MKKITTLFSIVMLAIIMLAAPAAKADGFDQQNNRNDQPNNRNDHDDRGDQGGNNNGCDQQPQEPAKLPINNGVVFLLIAGIAIGITSVNKFKATAVKL